MMNTVRSRVIVSAIAFCFAVAPAFGQRSHAASAGSGAGGPNGPAMGNGTAGHGNTGGKANGGTASSPTNVLSKNTKLDSTLTSNLQSKGLLPAGTGLKGACSGFKNLGQCVAAIHVSHNLKIPFRGMQSNITGTAPPAPTPCNSATVSTHFA